ncbi:hypothetical protein [Flavobacterium sp. N2820]|jgi:hypothetical protein|uniref:hypothetical protein n=1 Tax=Flavobacterium sp. N2820 TaxID=2986834 RepID=UPI00222593C0|nr:hypothetical protein [Flavobacterium sp. N2820]
MKKILIITICIITLSCNKSQEKPIELESLITKISILEEQNKKLEDSLSKIEEEFLFSQILLGISDKQTLKVGEKNNIVMLLQTFNRKLPKYEIFRIENGKEIKVGEDDGTRFDYEFIPKSIDDNSPEFLLKIPYNGKIIKIPGKLILDVKK